MKKEEEIDRLKEVLYSNFNKFNNPVLREVATKLYRLINNGKASLKDQYKRVFIDTLKFLSELEYLDKNYSLCLKRIKELQQCVVYKNETTSTINHATLRRFQCEIYLGIYQTNIILEDSSIDFSKNKSIYLKIEIIEWLTKMRALNYNPSITVAIDMRKSSA